MAPTWRERLSEGRILPHFQPIVSLETLEIAAYEALGRHQVGSETLSLGPFFGATAREPGLQDLRRDVDRSLRRAALAEFSSKSSPGQKLFLNVNPRLMIEHLALGTGELPWTLRMVAEVGIDPRQVVIELTEEAIEADTSALRELVDLYRAHGCGIAIDDVGAESSNLDRIGHFEPDIIKIDSAILRRSLGSRSFEQVLRGMAALAEGLGAALLFEGVETQADLLQAFTFGARYIQGWFFAKADSQFPPVKAFAPALKPLLEGFGRQLVDEDLAQRLRIRETMEALGRPPEPVQAEDGSWGFAPGALDFWGWTACRVFLTDRAGFQVSPNFEAGPGGWTTDYRPLGWCRSMRPYFPGGGDSRWSVSEVYYDVNDRSPLRTYSRPAGPDLLLFVDVLEIEKRVRSG